jgi:beta-galactosidase/beta-glucuronidase
VTSFGKALAGLACHQAQVVAKRRAMPYQQDFVLWSGHRFHPSVVMWSIAVEL